MGVNHFFLARAADPQHAKTERTRQRPFDEALQAKLEWMSQNWWTYLDFQSGAVF